MKKIEKNLALVTDEFIVRKIFLLRGRKVMLDRDLAQLYGVGTKVLNQSVKRNIERFPEDFMFRLNLNEFEDFRSQFATSNHFKNLKSQFVTSSERISLRSQFVTSKNDRGGRRYLPFAFTEQGVAMLSSVLKSETAIKVNIQIMRSFIKLRELLASNEQLRIKIEKMEKKYDSQFSQVFEAIKRLLREGDKPDEPMGFRLE